MFALRKESFLDARDRGSYHLRRPVSPQDKAVYFNAVPLLVVAASYLFVATALAVTLWRERDRATPADLALASIFPAVGIAAGILGVVVLYDRSSVGAHVWPPFVACLIALIPALAFLFRGRERSNVLISSVRAREAEELVSLRDRELDSVAGLARSLARTQDPAAAGRALLDEIETLLGAEFSALALISEDGREAHGLVARHGAGDIGWWAEMRIDLRNEPSGISSAYFDAAPVFVFDVESSPLVNRRLAETAGAKSAAFVPMTVDERVIGVLVVATTTDRRVFTPEELRLMQTVAGEAAIALDRTRSVIALDEALGRERLVATISRRVRSTRDLDELTSVAVTETGRALGASRCFLRLGEPGETLPMRAEWRTEGLKPIGNDAELLPVSNLAARDRRTVAVADALEAHELDDPDLGTRSALERLGSRSVLATPVVAFDRMLGVLALHRTEPGPWSDGDVGLAESVAHEIALAIHVAGLLEENERRLGEQGALLQAAQVVTSELELDAVLQRLVDEVAGLLHAEAVDCFLLDSERDVLRCAAVHGLPEEMVGFEFPADRGLAGRAIKRGRSALADDYAQVPETVPHAAYEGFHSAIVAPMRWAGEVKGVLGVGTRDPKRRLSRAEGELLEAFANLAALALRNAESFEEHSRQARVQRGFYRIASALGQPVSLEETFDALAQAAAEALGGSSAAVMMPRNDDLRLAGLHSLAAPLVRFLENGLGDPSGPLRSAARRRRVLAAPSLASDGRFGEDWRRVLDESGCRALLAAPVETPRSEEAALVIVFFDEERRFADDDLELTRNLTGAARGALERSELFESERRSRSLAEQLARTSNLLSPDLDPAVVLEEVVRRAPELLSADAAVLRLLEGDELIVGAAGGDGASADERLPSTARLAGDAVQSRAPVAVTDARGDNRLLQADPVLASGYAGYLAVPLIGPEGTVHGVLSVYSREPRAWTDDETKALTAFASNASAALSGAELYQRVALERERSFAILSNIADGIVAVDREGAVVLWNQAAEAITGVPAEEALGRPPREVLQRELQSPGEAPAGERLVSIRRGAEEIWLSLTEAVMRDPLGVVAGRIFAFRDISAERVVEQMKSEFVANVSRELRSPLTSIYGFAETLMRDDVLFGDAERATFLGYIASEAGRLTTIVDRLLSVARLDSGDLQVHLAVTDVSSVVRDVVRSAEHNLGGGHSFVLDLPPEPLEAEADHEKLRQIVADLVENAVKYSPEGGTIAVSARRSDDGIEVSVDDEGIGIPESERALIFTKFYRAGSGTRELASGGTGLGLFIAKELLEAMRGRIWVRPREERGSSFVFVLPAAGEPILSERE
jgi:PAS domain S-box-containing protein